MAKRIFLFRKNRIFLKVIKNQEDIWMAQMTMNMRYIFISPVLAALMYGILASDTPHVVFVVIITSIINFVVL